MILNLNSINFQVTHFIGRKATVAKGNKWDVRLGDIAVSVSMRTGVAQ